MRLNELDGRTRHFATKHVNTFQGRGYQCDICGRTFKAKGRAIVHVAGEHEDILQGDVERSQQEEAQTRIAEGRKDEWGHIRGLD